MKKETIKAGLTEEIKPGQMKRIPAENKNILVCNVNGEFYAVDDMCTHEDASLYLGCLKGDLVQCSLHGGKFNVKTGEAAEEPAEIALNTYKTIIIDNVITVEVE